MAAGMGRVIRHDLMCTDPAAGAEFYAALFGWSVTELRVMGMTVRRLSAGTRVVGAVMPFDKAAGFPSHWVPYMLVASVDDTCVRVAELGGEICMGGFDIPPGRFALAGDPAGALFSPFTPRELPDDPPPGRMEPGTFCWDELLTPDPGAAVRFYRQLFGWDERTETMAGGEEYAVLTEGSRPRAGVMRMPPGAHVRPSWLSYVATTDTDATAARAASLGAKVTTGPADIPGVGRFAVLADPTGARFALLAASG
ncbi:MAG TPA: VOC family protein [Gemmatimonadales bacterium]|jgi:predicted enzyme related to lactoylglutathione lyase|nr:VOC family protein [Gemmatimonadales bacterium]